MKERIKQLLISGLKASEIMSIVGCTAGYISQLMKDDDFRKQVEAGIMVANAEKKEEDHIETRYQNAEHLLLTAIAEKIPEASLGEVTRAIEVINKRKDDQHKRKNPLPQGPAVQVNVVSLALPQQVLRQISAPVVQLNENKEIIAIDNRPLAPLSSQGVKNLFAQLTAKDKAQEAIAREI